MTRSVRVSLTTCANIGSIACMLICLAIVTLLTPRWTDAAYDDRMYAAGRKWLQMVKNATTAMGTDHRFMYLNFASGFQNPFCGYGQDNVDFLRQTAKKYDPTGVFQTLLPGGFKVFEACP